MARYTNKIDSKGRVFVPSKLRDSMGKSIVVTLSLDSGYLSVSRLIIGEALVCDLDSQGRISISSELWEHIGAEPAEEISIIDLGDKLDICSKSFYEKKKEELSSVLDLDLTGYNVTGL